jgi:plastocyanin
MRRRIVPFIAAALLVASACASGASTASSDHERTESASATLTKAKTVHLPKSYKFEPDSIEVARGGVVTWVNEDDFPHTVQLLDGSEPDRPLAVGDSTSITFEKTGVYKYNCSLHPTQMRGSVTVRDGSS